MKRNYYCLISGLPDWKNDDRKPSMDTASFRALLDEELHSSDLKLVSFIYLPCDHQNILNRLYKKEKAFDERGNFSSEMVDQLTDALQFLHQEVLTGISYLDAFIARFFQDDVQPDRMAAERYLAEEWYGLLENSGNAFLAKYAQFEKETRNVFTALHSRKHLVNLDKNLIGEGDLMESFKKSRARDFGLSGEIQHMDQLLQIFEMPHLLEREMRLDLLRWQFLDEATFFHYFSIEKIISFVLKLIVVERWSYLDEQRGREMFNKLIADLQGSYDFPEEHKFSYGKK